MENKHQVLKNKINKAFKFVVEEADSNPNMKDFDGYHYKIDVINRETRERDIFNFSVGRGITDRDDLDLAYGLLSSLFIDRIYIDKEEFDGLGYEGKEAVDVYEAICENHDKMKDLGVIDFFESLDEEEQEILNNGDLKDGEE